MTLVARFSLDGVPFLVGDVLLSTPEVQKPQMIVPTIGETFWVKSTHGTPIGLKQKVSIFGGNLAIGWSGPVGKAKELFEELHFTALKERFTYERLTEIVTSYSRDFFEDFSVTGFIVEPGITGIFSRGQGITQFDCAGVDDIAILGTGAYHLRDVMPQITEAETFMPGNLDQISQAVCKCLVLSGTFLAAELGSLLSLEDLFGGAYEIVLPQADDTLIKYDDVTYVFHAIEKLPEGPWVVTPIQASKNSYVNDYLVVQTIPFDGPLETGAELSVHVITPVHKRWAPPSDDWFENLPALNSRYMCQYFVNLSNNSILASVSGGENQPIRFHGSISEAKAEVCMSRFQNIFKGLADVLGGEVHLRVTIEGDTPAGD